MRVKENRLDEKTVIPISLLVIAVPFLFWMATLHSRVNTNEKQLDALNSTAEGSIRSELVEHGKALARIEGALGTKNEKKN